MTNMKFQPVARDRFRQRLGCLADSIRQSCETNDLAGHGNVSLISNTVHMACNCNN
jgi:hypothetical protein